jgi:hypothetical protein
MPPRPARPLLAVLALALGGSVAQADPPPRPDPVVDVGFLEYLGSADSDIPQPTDLWWIDYVSKTDTGKVIKPVGGNPLPPGAKPAPPKPNPPVSSTNNG